MAEPRRRYRGEPALRDVEDQIDPDCVQLEAPRSASGLRRQGPRTALVPALALLELGRERSAAPVEPEQGGSARLSG
jgi:hypothetical protein